MTTFQINLLKELHAAGYNDREIAIKIGVSRETVTRYRTKLGLPTVENKHPPHRYIYKVYDAKSGRLVASGTSQEVVEQLELSSVDSLYSIAVNVRSGQNHKYRIEVEHVKYE